jgi:hypothetical protein
MLGTDAPPDRERRRGERHAVPRVHPGSPGYIAAEVAIRELEEEHEARAWALEDEPSPERSADLIEKRSPAVEFPALPELPSGCVSPHEHGVYDDWWQRASSEPGSDREREGDNGRDHGNTGDPKRLFRLWAVVRFRR